MRKTEDLTGQKFGLLTVIQGTGSTVECRCDCGNTVTLRRSNLLSGNTKSCGCLRRKRTSKDLTGQRFGKLTAIRATEQRQNGNILWECQCDCGNTAFVISANLIGGRIRSCGCLKSEQMNDLTGQRFGRLTAVRAAEERQNAQAVWECRCDCGNIVFVRSSNLVSGITKSCGCLLKSDLTGQKFGRLTAIRPTEERKKGNVIWECQCECGNMAFVVTENLTGNRTRSCGCMKKGNNAGSDLTGQKFGKLTVLGATEKRIGTSIAWECRCDCGKTILAARGNLITGKTQSCGCARRKTRKDETA